MRVDLFAGSSYIRHATSGRSGSRNHLLAENIHGETVGWHNFAAAGTVLNEPSMQERCNILAALSLERTFGRLRKVQFHCADTGHSTVLESQKKLRANGNVQPFDAEMRGMVCPLTEHDILPGHLARESQEGIQRISRIFSVIDRPIRPRHIGPQLHDCSVNRTRIPPSGQELIQRLVSESVEGNDGTFGVLLVVDDSAPTGRTRGDEVFAEFVYRHARHSRYPSPS